MASTYNTYGKVWMSLLLHPQRKDLLLSSITLLAALAITRSINEELLEMGFADSSQTLRNNADTKTSSSSILTSGIFFMLIGRCCF